MPGTPTIKGDATIIWGSDGTYGSSIVVSGRNLKTSDKEVILDNTGFAASVVYFNMRQEAELEIIVQTAAPDLNEGDFITVDSGTGYLVDDTEIMWEQRGARKFRIRATKYSQIAAS